MTGIAIYMEGGGDSPDGKAALRRGMDIFLARLKQAAQQRRWRWKLVACGGREQAKDAFLHARKTQPEMHCYLLVDAEAAVTSGPVAHLAKRDGWSLAGVGDDAIHLMVQVMETWLVADPDALSAYYGQSFRPKALPAAADLESVSKTDVATDPTPNAAPVLSGTSPRAPWRAQPLASLGTISAVAWNPRYSSTGRSRSRAALRGRGLALEATA